MARSRDSSSLAPHLDACLRHTWQNTTSPAFRDWCSSCSASQEPGISRLSGEVTGSSCLRGPQDNHKTWSPLTRSWCQNRTRTSLLVHSQSDLDRHSRGKKHVHTKTRCEASQNEHSITNSLRNQTTLSPSQQKSHPIEALPYRKRVLFPLHMHTRTASHSLHHARLSPTDSDEPGSSRKLLRSSAALAVPSRQARASGATHQQLPLQIIQS